jgi:hypothetical protein
MVQHELDGAEVASARRLDDIGGADGVIAAAEDQADDGPRLKPWGTYEFAVSDPNGTLVRIGRVAD